MSPINNVLQIKCVDGNKKPVLLLYSVPLYKHCCVMYCGYAYLKLLKLTL